MGENNMRRGRGLGFGRPTVVRCPKQAQEIIDSIYNRDGTLKDCKPHKFTKEDYTPKRPIEEILGITEDASNDKDSDMNIKDIVKNNTARFTFYRSGQLHYEVVSPDGRALYTFPVDITDTDDIGRAAFDAEMKAITLMRYIRKAMKSDQLVKLSN